MMTQAESFLRFKLIVAIAELQMSRNVRKPTMWFLTRSDTSQAVATGDG